ncbi:MAG: DNA invertase Pin-like site-specific DNA recombinase [Phenylobacterium sp.]|jgi:DNA invertase Pin-like site-specific DNA recombinase
MAMAYSYIRFSSEKQSKGNSLQRQKDLVAQWKADNPAIPLSDKRYEDLGKSGYKGQHIEVKADDGTGQDGGLGLLLKAINERFIQSGDYLIVESMDRLGRLKPIKMLSLFGDIVSKGVTIVTLEDSQEYKESTFEEGQFHVLIGKIQAAYAYSEQLSRRVSKARENTRQQLADGQVKKLSRSCPFWLVWDEADDDWRILEDRKRIVELIFQMYIEGHGIFSINSYLNQNYPNGIANKDDKSAKGQNPQDGKISKGWHYSNITRTLFDRRVIGEVCSKGRQISDYYPRVIRQALFQQAVDIRSKRVTVNDKTKGKSKPLFNLFQDLVFCVCGSSCKFENKGNGSFIYTCKKRRRGLCNLSSGLNAKLIDDHIRPFLTMIAMNDMHDNGTVKHRGGGNDTTDDLGHIKECEGKLTRLVNLYKSGIYDEEEEALKEIQALKNQITDLKALKEEQDYKAKFVTNFSVGTLNNKTISGYDGNMYLKSKGYKITLFDKMRAVLSGGDCDTKLQVQRLSRTGLASLSVILLSPEEYQLRFSGKDLSLPVSGGIEGKIYYPSHKFRRVIRASEEMIHNDGIKYREFNQLRELTRSSEKLLPKLSWKFRYQTVIENT